jgi:hypothetical protein
MKKHYGPNPEVLSYIENLTTGKKVLELGPGHLPFKNATHFVGWQHGVQPIDKGENYKVCDFNHHPLPYADQEFDFVYCRHVLEDLIYPFRVVEEMQRVAKAGYIETPSPMAEVKKGIDGGSPQWRGYHHHIWYVWSNDGKLNFAKKYPVTEYFSGIREKNLEQLLEELPHMWNTYFLWEDTFQYQVYQHGVDFEIATNYNQFVCDGMIPDAVNSTAQFYRKALNV